MITAPYLRALLATALLPLTAAVSAAPAPHPEPRYDPAAVVQIQLKALAHNDKPGPDAGLAVAFAFSSPGNREQTGPLERFSAMVHASYGQLLNHRSAHLNPVMIQGDHALQGVELVDSKGDTARFVFMLSRQSEPPYAGCWMIDGVLLQPKNKDQQDL